MKKSLDPPGRFANPRAGAPARAVDPDGRLRGAGGVAESMGVDRELVRRVAEGDMAAFEELYSDYRARVTSFLARVMRGSSLARDHVDEAVNDTMVAVWRQASRFRGEAKASTWILGIAYRVGLKTLRDLKRRRDEVSVDDVLLLASGGPEQSYSERELHDRIQRGLERLSASHRAVVELAFFEGYSYREIAEIVDCPENTVKTRMFHARRQLRRYLEPDSEVVDRPRPEIVRIDKRRKEESS